MSSCAADVKTTLICTQDFMCAKPAHNLATRKHSKSANPCQGDSAC